MKISIVTNFNPFSKRLIKLISFLLLSSFIWPAQAKIVSSIKPIGFITAAIADGVTESEILLPDGASPHTYALRPSDLIKIKSADLIVWIGDSLETFMPNVLKSIDENKQIELMDISEVKALLRKGHSHDHEEGEHSHDHDHHHDHDHSHDLGHHHHGEYDEHIWLSPTIAKLIAQSIHDKLIILYPTKKAKIEQNLSTFIIKLTEAEQNIAKKLLKVQNNGYFVFHDAYGYFESQFGLKNLGSFTINPAVQPGAKKVYAIQQKLKEHQAVCIFKEPQFSPAVIEKLLAGTNVRAGELDPLGMEVSLSKDAYPHFLLALTQQFLKCLDHE